MNIYVGNLPYRTTEDELRGLFESYGEVTSAKIITDRDTGQARGFAFVEMDDESGRRAIEELNGNSFQGKNLTVNEARPRTEGGGGNRGGGSRGGYSGGGGRSSYGDRSSGGSYGDRNSGGGGRRW